jgi:hypothetical protein
MLSRTQRVIAAHLAELGIETKEASRIARKQPIANPGSIKYVDSASFRKSLKQFKLTWSDLDDLLKYINESPKANQHYWNFTKGKKKDFQQLIDNMS